MAMFGSRKPFDDANVLERAGQVSGSGGLPDLGLQQPLPTPQAQPESGGFFSKNGAWRDVLGGVGDALSAAGGGQGVYMQHKLHQNQLQQQMPMLDQKRKQDRKRVVEGKSV